MSWFFLAYGPRETNLHLCCMAFLVWFGIFQFRLELILLSKISPYSNEIGWSVLIRLRPSWQLTTSSSSMSITTEGLNLRAALLGLSISVLFSSQLDNARWGVRTWVLAVVLIYANFCHRWFSQAVIDYLIEPSPIILSLSEAWVPRIESLRDSL